MCESVGPTNAAILIDMGGMLVPEYLPAAAARWSARLSVSEQHFLDALFRGNDDQVLIGRVSEQSWWSIVQYRLGIDLDLLDELRDDLAASESWEESLVSYMRGLRGHTSTAIVSNAWPGTRARMSTAGILDVVDEIVLSC